MEPNQAGVPDLVHEVVPLDDLPRVLEEDAQELELLHGQLERLARTGRYMRVEVHADVSGLEDGLGRRSGLPDRRRTARMRAASSAALNGLVT